MSLPVEENYRKVRCMQCGTETDLGTGKAVGMPPCPNCGVTAYKRIGVNPVCDFCSLAFQPGDACWTYPCGVFVYPFQAADGSLEWNSGPWSACKPCHELVEAGDMQALSEHAVSVEIGQDPRAAVHRSDLLQMISALHREFAKHRTGEPFREVYRDGDWLRADG